MGRRPKLCALEWMPRRGLVRRLLLALARCMGRRPKLCALGWQPRRGSLAGAAALDAPGFVLDLFDDQDGCVVAGDKRTGGLFITLAPLRGVTG